MIKKAVFLIVFMLVFSFGVRAENTYGEQLKQSGIEEVYENLPDDTKRVIERFDIDLSSPDWVNKLTPKGIFEEVLTFFTSGLKEPLKCGVGMLAVIVLVAVANTFEGFKAYTAAASYIFTVCFSVGLITPLFSLIESCSSAVKGISTLMNGFIPVYAGILTVSGQGITASGMSFLMLFASSAVSSLSSFFVVPLMSCYLGMGIAGSVSELSSTEKFGETIKKAALWILSFAFTLFLGLLTVQTSVNTAADNLGVKTAKFMLGSFVPVAGGALSESLTTLLGSVKLLKSSVGMFGVVAISATVLPIIIELLIWRIMLFLILAVSELFGINIKLDVIKAADSVLAVLVGVLLFSAALFIISLAIVSGR